MPKKYDQKFLKTGNQGRILKLLREKGPLTRVEISKELGIVKSTASEICNELISLNIINEGEKIEGNLGKRPTLINFNQNFNFFIAIVITTKETNIAVCDLSGEIIKEEIITHPEDVNSAKDIINLAFKKVDEIYENIGCENIFLISLGSPETFNIRTGKIKWAPYIKDWLGVDLKKLFYEKYKSEVIIKDHVKLETLGEKWKSFSNISNLAYITITYGIGSGAIIDDKIREGKNGYLGEIAFLPVSENINYDELIKGNKNLGYFESQCDVLKIIETANIYLANAENKSIKKINSFDDVVFLYKTDNLAAEFINNQIIKTLALGIASLIILLDPETVVINGEIVDLGNNFLNLLKQEIFKIIPYKREILFSELRSKSRIYGAIKNGLDHIEKLIYEDPEVFYKKMNSPKL
jgi:predicted NBD/HSP70 family sugar kinase